MATELFQRCSAHIRAAQAADMGCDVADYDRLSVTVVTRPEKVLYLEYAALVTTFGVGTVISVEEPYREWVLANQPKKPQGCFNVGFLASLGAEVEARGIKTAQRSIAVGLAPAECQEQPDGHTVVTHGRDWMDEWRSTSLFENSVGEPGEDDWANRLMRAFVIHDAAGEPLACAALADDGNGCAEIGVDVRVEAQAQGLARPVVIAAMRHAFDQGLVPYYTFGAWNVRSHRLGESCGFRPLWTVAGVAKVVAGVGSQTG